MQLSHHKHLTVEKWATFSYGKQILMIANELNRAKNLLIRNDYPETRHCYERAYELLFLSLSLPMPFTRRKELTRFKSVLQELFLLPHPSIEKNSQLYQLLITLSSEAYNALHPRSKDSSLTANG